MPQIIVTPGAGRGLERCRQFLAAKNPNAAKRAAQAIERQFKLLTHAPDMGRPYPDQPELRELIIPFGATGYIALYQHEPADDAVYILAFRHMREAGY